MNKLSKYILFCGLIFAVAFTAACPKRTSIADLNANPSKYQNKTIAIAGKVKQSYGASIPGTPISGGIYEIDDGTGTIWVVTDKAVPAKNSEIGVQGKFGNAVSYNGKNYGSGIFEDKRRSRPR
jgi:hypothetical protein